ncbi:MAG TPA: 2-hydroxyacid dehydrogenase, partial [Caulobacteraceae bacterium]|nr:2-hydroxyacid dehydrogenase [Caulobacteraceae bacterium]
RASEGFRAQIAAAFADAEPVVAIDETDRATFAAEMRDAVALLHVLEPVTAAVIAAAPKLRLIQKIGVGVNTIDIEAARAHGVAVCNMPGTNSAAVAEMALSLMIGVLRRTVYFDALTRAGEGWRPDLAVLDQVGEIAGRTVGLVGFGGSAQRLAPVLAALGARVVYTARSARPGAPYPFLALDALLAESDIVSLHVPSTPQTRRMIDAAALARMKRGAILINTARGDLVDETALAEALRSGHLRGAGLDVFAAEPTAPDNPLFALPQALLAPHVAWLTPETLARSLVVARENCRRVEAGGPLLHQVA